MGLHLLHPVFLAAEPVCDLVFEGKELGVFRIALGGVFGKHAEIAVDEKGKGDHPKGGADAAADEHGNKQQHAGNDGDKTGQLVRTVAAGHKADQAISHTHKGNLTF